MNEPSLFEEMLTTYPAEKRELARAVYHRFAEADSTQFFTQLFLVLDVYAHYVERIPTRMISANADSLATAEEIRGEIAHIATAIETRDVNITNHAEQTDELCRQTQTRIHEAVTRIESLMKNLGTQVDTKAIVQGIQVALDTGIKGEIISPLIQHSKELGERVLPVLKEIKEASSEAHTLWMKHIWKTAWAGSFLVTFTLFTVATTGIYDAFDHYAERKDAEKIAYAERLMNYNQAAFRELAIAQVPIKVLRTESNGVTNPQSFALVIEGADSVETRDEDGHKSGYIFFTSHLSEEQIQLLQQQTAKLAQPTGSAQNNLPYPRATPKRRQKYLAAFSCRAVRFKVARRPARRLAQASLLSARRSLAGRSALQSCKRAGSYQIQGASARGDFRRARLVHCMARLCLSR